MNTLLQLALAIAVLSHCVQAAANQTDTSQPISQIEIQLLEEKVALLRDKLEVLELLRASQQGESELSEGQGVYDSYDLGTLNELYRLSLYHWELFSEGFKSRFQYNAGLPSHQHKLLGIQL